MRWRSPIGDFLHQSKFSRQREGAKKYILKILSDADEIQTTYEQENSLGGDDWGAGDDWESSGW